MSCVYLLHLGALYKDNRIVQKISLNVSIPDDEVEFSAIRAQGTGGQNVNKVSSAIHLRFDIHASSLPDCYKQRLFSLRDQRISKEGVIVIKAQRFRSQGKNREDALGRFLELIKDAVAVPKARRLTKATRGSKEKRLNGKTHRSKTKKLRGRVSE